MEETRNTQPEPRQFVPELLRMLVLTAALAAIFLFTGTQRRTFSFAFVRSGASALLEEIASAFEALPLFPAPKLNGEDEGRVNFLLLGMSGPGHLAPDLTDTILVISMDPERKRGVLVGVPRDLLIAIPGTNSVTKINSLYVLEKNSGRGGNAETERAEKTTMIQQAVEEVTGLTLHYTTVVNLAALHDIVEKLGGIEVVVEKPLYDPRFPTPGGGTTTFTLGAGTQVLDGRTAERYARTRNDREGDFGRMKRQMQVLAAMQKKAFRLNLVNDFSKLLGLYDALKTNVRTSLEIGEMRRLWQLARNMSFDDLAYLALESRSDNALLTGGPYPLGETVASALWPKEGMFEYDEIKQRIQHELGSE